MLGGWLEAGASDAAATEEDWNCLATLSYRRSLPRLSSAITVIIVLSSLSDAWIFEAPAEGFLQTSMKLVRASNDSSRLSQAA